MKTVEFYVPSYGRSGDLRILRNHPDLCEQVVLVVREEEESEYDKHRSAFKGILSVRGVVGIADTRRQIFEKATTDHVFMFDDDLTISSYRPGANSYRKASETAPLLESLRSLAQRAEGTSVAKRQGAHDIRLAKKLAGFRPGGQMLFAWGLDRQLALTMDWDIPVMEDYYAAAQLLAGGGEHLQVVDWVVDGAKGRGGCDLWRTSSHQKEAAEKLVNRFPHAATRQENTSGVRISWRSLRGTQA